MKKIIPLLLILTLVSCSKVAVNLCDEHTFSDRKDYTVGYSIVKQMLTQTKSDCSLLDIAPYVEDSDTLFYIANFERGWKIIANDQRITPVLAQDDTGNLRLDSLANENLRFWLDVTADYIKHFDGDENIDEIRDNIAFWESFPEIKIKNKNLKSPKTKDIFDSLTMENYSWGRELISSTSNTTYNNVDHLTITSWGQRLPWNVSLGMTNDLTGEVQYLLAGCVPVAIGQLFYHLHHTIGKPSGLYHNYSLISQSAINGYYYLNFYLYNYQNPSNRWNAMAIWDELFNPETSCSISDNIRYVSDYLLYIGYVLGVAYSFTDSGVTSITPTIFSSNGITFNTSSYNANTIETYIRAGQPVMITGYTQDGNGHCWLIDAILEELTQTVNTYRWFRLGDDIFSGTPPNTTYYTEEDAYNIDPLLYDGKIQVENLSNTNKRWKMNWGWNGESNNATFAVFGSLPYPQNINIYYNFQ